MADIRMIWRGQALPVEATVELENPSQIIIGSGLHRQPKSRPQVRQCGNLLGGNGQNYRRHFDIVVETPVA